jgi:hypothetical protein
VKITFSAGCALCTRPLRRAHSYVYFNIYGSGGFIATCRRRAHKSCKSKLTRRKK